MQVSKGGALWQLAQKHTASTQSAMKHTAKEDMHKSTGAHTLCWDKHMVHEPLLGV